MKKKWLYIVLLLLCSEQAFSQLIVVPLSRTETISKKHSAARTKLTAMPLPFWDDFSFSDSIYFPHDTIWQEGKSIWINTGVGINPPSIGVATFDGVDSLGMPYSVNDVLAKGIGDSLVSRAIRLDLVPVEDRNTVYLSFYYQFRGNGEPPDQADQLVLLFKNDIGKWESVLVLENEGLFDPEIFYQVFVPVNQEKFFHDQFQFRLHTFGRQSGPYDTWNVDYVYLNSGRSATDSSYPDRTITSDLTSLFGEYWSIPKEHFFIDPLAVLTRPSFDIYNLRVDNDQPMNYFSYATITNYNGGVANTLPEALLDSEGDVGGSLQGLQRRTVTVATLPDVNDLDPLADSITISFKLGLSTKDNVEPIDQGDYIPEIYSPIDFRLNDTIRSVYHLNNYYAYDDGHAEYGAGLNQPGAQLAYLFKMKTTESDTIVAVDLYFPVFGDESTQSIQLQILKDLSGNAASILFTESVIVQRSSQDKFWRHKLSRFVGVQGDFYVSWKQSNASILAIGLDKNTDSGANIYSNINGSWNQNISLKGSLMMRPVFGKGGGIVTGIEDNLSAIKFYPNPSSGVFFVADAVDRVQVYDLAGRTVSILVEDTSSGKQVTLQNPSAGLYVLRLYEKAKVSSHRIIVR